MLTLEFHMIAIGELIKHPKHSMPRKPQRQAYAITTANVSRT